MLLTIFLFQVGGYYFVFLALRHHADQKLTERIDANLNLNEEAVEFKIPVVLPYPIYAQGFQRVDGRFEHEGEFYKLVKQKHEKDTLYVVCIRDEQTRELTNTLKDYVQLTHGLNSTHQKAMNLISKVATDFYSEAHSMILCVDSFRLVNHFSIVVQIFQQQAIPVHSPPPRG